jgi:KDO2-lipid IV(A) lauroyltransferase
MTARDTLVDAAYAAGWSAVRHVPDRVAAATFRALGDAAWRRHGRGVQQLERNLTRVLGGDAGAAELSEASRAAMRSYFRYWCEVFRLPEWSDADVIARIVVGDEQRLRDFQASGRGVVVALGHSGNWDHAGAWSSLTGMPFTTVAERLHPESLFDRFVAYRESLGMEVLPLTGTTDLMGTLRARLSAGGIVALVADRDLTKGGLEVNFFGEPAKMPSGPAALALRTGAYLMPMTSWYDDEHTHIQMHPAVEPPEASLGFRAQVQQMTQSFADVLEGSIREHPADWHMLQRLWTSDLSGAAG